METTPKTVEGQLDEWFRSVLALADKSLFAIVPEGPHRDAVVLDVLKRNARIVYRNEMDTEGKLYSPLCFFLAAACRKLGASLGIGHWRAAVDNVVHLEQQNIETRAESAAVGLDIGTPAVRFKHEFDEAIIQSGLAVDLGYLNKEDRQIALGLAINWGIRLLLAYAVECSTNGSNRKDLGWLRKLMESSRTTRV